MLKKVYVLMSDGDMTLHSQPEPFGVAVTSEEEARKYAQTSENRDYQELAIFDDQELAVVWAYRDLYENILAAGREQDALVKARGGAARLRELLRKLDDE